MPNKFIYAYKFGSKSAIALARSIDAKIIKLEGSKFRGSREKVVVNWGNSRPYAELDSCVKVLNPPRVVERVSNKLTFFNICSEGENNPRVPDFTIRKEKAVEWLEAGVNMIFARKVLTGHSGDGIEKITNTEELNQIEQGTLLVKYVPKKREFRAHFYKRDDQPLLFLVQEKKLKRGVNNPDYHIRNLDNGFVFTRENVEVPQDVIEQSKLAFTKSNLDFGAVDVIYNERGNSAYVLEINSAPGLEGTTIDDYSRVIGELI